MKHFFQSTAGKAVIALAGLVALCGILGLLRGGRRNAGKGDEA